MGKPLQIWSDEHDFKFGESGAAYEFLKVNPSIAKKFLNGKKVDEGEVDWDRLGLAISTLGTRFGTHIETRMQELGEEVGQTISNMSDTLQLEEIGEFLAPSPEASRNPNVRSGARTPETGFDHVEIDTDTDTDMGKQAGEFIVNTIDDIVGWTAEQMNAWTDSILGDVNDDQILDFKKCMYKLEPSEQTLQACQRARY